MGIKEPHHLFSSFSVFFVLFCRVCVRNTVCILICGWGYNITVTSIVGNHMLLVSNPKDWVKGQSMKFDYLKK